MLNSNSSSNKLRLKLLRILSSQHSEAEVLVDLLVFWVATQLQILFLTSSSTKHQPFWRQLLLLLLLSNLLIL